MAGAAPREPGPLEGGPRQVVLKDAEAGPPVAAWEVGLLILLALLFQAVTLRFLELDASPGREHSGTHLANSYRTSRNLAVGSYELSGGPYPPLTELVGAAAFAVAGPSPDAARALNSLWLLPLMGGVWWLGRQIGGPWGGLAAAAGVAGNPIVCDHVRAFQPDLAATALLAPALVATVLVARAPRLAPALWLGLLVGLGMLARWTFLFFFLVPGLVLVGKATRRSWSGRGVVLLAVAGLALAAADALGRGPYPEPPFRPVTVTLLPWMALLAGGVALPLVRGRGRSPADGLAVAAGTAGLVSCWWYLYATPFLLDKASDDLQVTEVSPASWLVQALGLMDQSFTAFAFLLAVGVWVGCRRPRTRGLTLLLVAAALVGLGATALTRIALDYRYVLPAAALLPPLAFGWLGTLPRLPRLAGGLAVLGLGLFQAGWWALPPGLLPGSLGAASRGFEFALLAPPLGYSVAHPRAGVLLPLSLPPEREAWDPQELVSRLPRRSEGGPQEILFITPLLGGNRAEPDHLFLAGTFQGLLLDVRPIQWNSPEARVASVALGLDPAEAGLADPHGYHLPPGEQAFRSRSRALPAVVVSPDPTAGPLPDEVERWLQGTREAGRWEEGRLRWSLWLPED